MIPEVTRVIEIALSHYSVTYPLFRWYYKKIVKDEIVLGEINKHDRVMCIGGGAFPATAIEIHRQTGAKVDVLDCDQEAVIHAVDLLKRMDLDNEINVFFGCGQTFDPKAYQVVHIALQVRDRERILANLQRHSLPGTRILARFPKECMEKFYHRSCGKISDQIAQESKHLLVNPRKTLKGTCVMVQGGKMNGVLKEKSRSFIGNPVSDGTVLADGYFIRS